MKATLLRGLARLAVQTASIAALAALLVGASVNSGHAETPPANNPLSEPLPEPSSEPEAPVPEVSPEDAPIIIEESAREYMDAEAFRSAFEGRTIHLTWNGAYYGSEQYLPGDRSVWTARGGECQPGFWVYDQQLICFTYATSPTSCWRVFRSSGSVYAESIDGLLLKIVSVTDQPLNCEPDLLS